MKASEARQRWSEILNGVFRGNTRVVVEKSGIPVAAVISAQDLERLNQLEAQREERFRVLDRMREAFKDVPPEEIEREVAQAIAEVRAERRQYTSAQEE
jgi:prevent-host-death family protein